MHFNILSAEIHLVNQWRSQSSGNGGEIGHVGPSKMKTSHFSSTLYLKDPSWALHGPFVAWDGPPDGKNWPLQTQHGSPKSCKFYIFMGCWQWKAAILDILDWKGPPRIREVAKFHPFHHPPPPGCATVVNAVNIEVEVLCGLLGYPHYGW